jgi:hypothetical protein
VERLGPREKRGEWVARRVAALKAVGVTTDEVREPRAAWELKTPAGLQIEVRSAAFLLSWRRAKLWSSPSLRPKENGRRVGKYAAG